MVTKSKPLISALEAEADAAQPSAHVQARILAEALPNMLSGIVRHVDFLGTYCLASIDVDGFDGQKMLVYFSLNQTHELGVKEGARIPFALRAERVRVFSS